MKPPKPPDLAMYLLSRFGSPYHRESLAGDLFEQFQHVRTRRKIPACYGRSAEKWISLPP
jgi:hypothetical protein